MFNFFKRRKTVSLRQACVDEYGEEFGRKYDLLNNGGAIGGYSETVQFVEDVEVVRDK